MTLIPLFTWVGGVREGCMPGVGATPPSRLPRRLTPRWSLPPPLFRYPKRICPGYRRHLRKIRTGSAQHPSLIPRLIPNRCTVDCDLNSRRLL